MDPWLKLPLAAFRRIDRDPRHWQIFALSGLFFVSMVTSSFGTSFETFGLALCGALTAQLLGTLLVNARGREAAAPWLNGFEYKSALITSFGVTLLLRAADPWIWFAAAFTGIALKFLVRVNGKHLFNPACIGIVVMMLWLGKSAWVSPGQWGQAPLVAGYALAFAALVLSSAKRLDIALGFLGGFAAILFARAIWLGDPLAIPLHQLSSGSLLIFAFFMITDPRSTPNSRMGRILFAFAVAGLAAWFIIGPNQRGAPLMALAALAWLTPVLDKLVPAKRFEWIKPAETKEDSREDENVQGIDDRSGQPVYMRTAS